MATISLDAGGLIELFNPQNHRWNAHSALVGAEIVGVTHIGRATIQLLDMNEEERLKIRAHLQAEGLL